MHWTYSGASTASLTSFEYDYSKPQSLEAGEGYKIEVIEVPSAANMGSLMTKFLEGQHKLV